MAPKLTETFNDKAKAGKAAPLHVTPAHEPLKDEPSGGINQRSDGGSPTFAIPPLSLPFPPAPPVEAVKEPEITEAVPTQTRSVRLIPETPKFDFRNSFVPVTPLVQREITAPSVAPAP